MSARDRITHSNFFRIITGLVLPAFLWTWILNGCATTSSPGNSTEYHLTSVSAPTGNLTQDGEEFEYRPLWAIILISVAAVSALVLIGYLARTASSTSEDTYLPPSRKEYQSPSVTSHQFEISVLDSWSNPIQGATVYVACESESSSEYLESGLTDYQGFVRINVDPECKWYIISIHAKGYKYLQTRSKRYYGGKLRFKFKLTKIQ